MKRYLRNSPNRIDKPTPLVACLFRRMNSEQVTNSEMERQSGVVRNAIRRWGVRRSVPNVDNLEACLNVVGMTLIAVPIEHAPKTRSISAKHELVEWFESVVTATARMEKSMIRITYPLSFTVINDRVTIIDASLRVITEVIPGQVPQYLLDGTPGNYVPTTEDRVAIAKMLVDGANAQHPVAEVADIRRAQRAP